MKQTSAVLALFLGTTDARMKMRAPKSINLFATGMAGDEDLGQDIIMKGDKYHYQQMNQLEISESAPVMTQPVRARDDAKDEPKKEEKKDEKKSEKKGEKKDGKKEEKKGDAKEEKKGDAKDAKADAKDAKADAKDDAKDAKDDEKKEEEKEEKKEQKPGEATWEDHNDCKENEWEAGDGNCAFEAEAVKIASHDHRDYSARDLSLVQTNGPQGIAKDDTPQFQVKYPVTVSKDGYPDTEKVHTLSPEVHMEVNNIESTYLFPRTAFYVEIEGQNGLWMSEDPSNIESVKGPSAGAPIGATVHDIAIKGGEPYADMHNTPEPARGIQHQPVHFDGPAEAAAKPLANQGVTPPQAPGTTTEATGALKDPKAAAAAAPVEGAQAAEPKKEEAKPAEKAAAAPAAPAEAAPEAKAALAQMRGEPAKDQSENMAVSPNGMGTYIHGLTNAVDTFAYKHNEPKPEREAQDQPVQDNSWKSIAHAEANLKKTENAVINRGLTTDNAIGFKTRGTGPVIDKKDAEAAAAAESKPEGEVKNDNALMQKRNKGDDDAPPKGFQNIDSVKGPDQGAPIGAAVHAKAIQDGEPYARMHDEPEPARGVQHQPFLFREDHRIKVDQAMPKSVNPGFTAEASSNKKTIGTGALKDPKEEEKALAGENAAGEKHSGEEPKKESKEKVDPEAKADAKRPPTVPDAKAAIQLPETFVQRADIGDKKIDEEVWGFVNADKNTLPWQHRRNEEAYPSNGWANPPGRFALDQRNTKTKDISDKNIDEEVWGFVNADKNTLPWQHRRNEEAYPANGWANPAGRFALDQRNTKTKDIGDKKIDEEVWGFVNADKNTLPWQHRRNEEPYPANGWANPAGRFALDQKKDISDKKIDEEVWGFVNDDKNTLPWQHRRNEEPYPANGWLNPAGRFALQQRQKNKIAEVPQVEPNVYDFVHDKVESTDWIRNTAPYAANGGDANGWGNGNPSLIQTEFLGNPERVSVSDPIAYQTRANTNTIDGGIQIRRTSFYNKKHAAQQEVADML